MKHVLHLRCLVCGREYLPEEIDYVCPRHENEGVLDVCYDYDRISRAAARPSWSAGGDRGMWRYRASLPVQPDSVVPPLAVGGTPLYRAAAIERALGLREVRLKDDGLLPTASLKDRASALAVVKAQERGAEVISTASTGNAAAALAGLCASVGRPNAIFVPETAPPAKIAQLLAYGSTVMLVEGSYDDAFELCLQACREFGWYCRNTGFNPYMSEGKKTVVYEICEQLDWAAPDAILVSVGDGCIIGGLHKGLRDLRALGWISQTPRLIGVQAEGSDFLTQAWEKDEDPLTKAPIQACTAADSISAGLPRDRLKAMAAVRETAGAFLRVSDEEILAAVPALARATGVFAEPAGAACYAGLLAALERGLVDRRERLVLLNTGNGLKDVAGAMRAVQASGRRAYPVAPNLESLKRTLALENLERLKWT